MSIDAVRNQAQLDGVVGPPDEEIALYRDYLHNSTLSQGLGGRPFEGLSWDYFLADVQLEARAARIRMRDQTVGSICDAIQALSPTAIVRLMAARFAYFTPLAPENEAQVDEVLQPLDAATAKLMRQRRHAVHAAQAIETKQEEARKETAARRRGRDLLLREVLRARFERRDSECAPVG